MINPKCIIPECHADTFFIELIKQLKPGAPNHKHGKTKVLKTLAEINVPKALGIIDNDPHASVKINLQNYEYELVEGEKNDVLRLFKHKQKDFYIIEIYKEFEHWIFHQVMPEAGVNSHEYDIPNDWKAFSKYFKDEDIREKERTKQFFKALLSSESNSLRLFIKWLNQHTE